MKNFQPLATLLLIMSLAFAFSCKKKSSDETPSGYRLTSFTTFTNNVQTGSGLLSYSSNLLTEMRVTVPTTLKTTIQFKSTLEYTDGEISRMSTYVGDGTNWIPYDLLNIVPSTVKGYPGIIEETQYDSDTSQIRTVYQYIVNMGVPIISSEKYYYFQGTEWLPDGDYEYVYDDQYRLQSAVKYSQSGHELFVHRYVWQNKSVSEDYMNNSDSSQVSKTVYAYQDDRVIKQTVFNLINNVWTRQNYTDYTYDGNGCLASETTTDSQTSEINRTVYTYSAGSGNLRDVLRCNGSSELWPGAPVPVPKRPAGGLEINP